MNKARSTIGTSFAIFLITQPAYAIIPAKDAADQVKVISEAENVKNAQIRKELDRNFTAKLEAGIQKAIKHGKCEHYDSTFGVSEPAISIETAKLNQLGYTVSRHVNGSDAAFAYKLPLTEISVQWCKQ